jgi:hypothetical protein
MRPGAAGDARMWRAAGMLTVGMAAAVVGSATLAALLPIGFSIAIVFLFAGLHNWLEARYLLSRMPPRWGRLRTYYATGIGGVVGLTAGMIALPSIAASAADPPAAWTVLLAMWNSALVLWVAALATLRARQNPRRDWPWIWPLALAVTGAAWLAPVGWSLVLVYLHPLVALAFLDAEIGRRRPELRRAYRGCLLAVPAALAVLAWRLAAAADLAGADVLTAQITAHAGAGIVPRVSTHFLVSAHTFLEMLHYAAWCLGIPLLTAALPWRLDSLPLARKSSGWRRAVVCLLATGAAAVVLLWAAFAVDYPLTRSAYFTVALAHVLAEVPFLLRES